MLVIKNKSSKHKQLYYVDYIVKTNDYNTKNRFVNKKKQ